MAQTYTVKAGDTLSKIGQQYGVDYRQITGYKSGNPNVIHPGEVLTIPTATPAPTPTSTSTPTSSFNSEPRSAQDLIKMGYTGYAGWDDAGAIADFKATGGQGKGGQINKYLDNFQSNMFSQASMPEVRTPEQIKAEVMPEAPRPQAPNYLQMFEQARKDFGVTGLEAQMNELKAQQDEVLTQRRQRVISEEGKPVATSVIAGRVSEVERQEAERLDTVQRALTRVTDQLNTAYSGINQIMQLTQMTYEDASKAWNSEFDQNMSIYGLASDSRKEAREEVRYQQQVASANLQTFTNLLTSGNMSYDQFSPDQKTQLAKLSVQAGFPVDFISRVGMKPQDKMLFANQETGQVVFMDQTGNVSVQNIPGYTPPPKAGDVINSNVADFVSELWKESGNSDTSNDITSLWPTSNTGESKGMPSAEIGTIKTDPETGTRWIFTESGWVAIGIDLSGH